MNYMNPQKRRRAASKIRRVSVLIVATKNHLGGRNWGTDDIKWLNDLVTIIKYNQILPSGIPPVNIQKTSNNYEQITTFNGKTQLYMAMFNSYII